MRSVKHRLEGEERTIVCASTSYTTSDASKMGERCCRKFVMSRHCGHFVRSRNLVSRGSLFIERISGAITMRGRTEATTTKRLGEALPTRRKEERIPPCLVHLGRVTNPRMKVSRAKPTLADRAGGVCPSSQPSTQPVSPSCGTTRSVLLASVLRDPLAVL